MVQNRPLLIITHVNWLRGIINRPLFVSRPHVPTRHSAWSPYITGQGRDGWMGVIIPNAVPILCIKNFGGDSWGLKAIKYPLYILHKCLIPEEVRPY